QVEAGFLDDPDAGSGDRWRAADGERGHRTCHPLDADQPGSLLRPGRNPGRDSGEDTGELAKREDTMLRPIISFLLLVLIILSLRTDDASAFGSQEPPSRAEQWKTIQTDYRMEYDALIKDVRAGKVKVKDGLIPELGELQ